LGNSIEASFGKIFYETGELKYEGQYILHPANHYLQQGKGIEYYTNGIVYREGIFTRGGLLEGKEYYSSGKIKFEGRFNSKEERDYYGPTYPLAGRFYSENRSLLYDGEFTVEHQGSMGYPKVIIPSNYGPLK
jgi:antitoxin component YwqK of YwqJK toxin-antitoxin module